MQIQTIKSSISIGVLLIMSGLAFSGDTPAPEDRLSIVNPPGLYDPAPNGYSHVVVSRSTSRVAYVAGQGGEDANGVLAEGFEDQVRQAYANLLTALSAIDTEPEQVAKITTYVVDYDQSMLSVMTDVVTEVFGEALPAQTLVPVPRLALDGMLFEVDAVAILD